MNVVHVAERTATASRGDCSPDCAICEGVGYVRYEVPLGHPKFGRIERCPNAQAQAIRQALESGDVDPRQGLTPNELRELTWSMALKGVNQADTAGKVARRAYASGFGLIFLHGGYGQGKSLILKIATAIALRDGKRAAYANLGSVLDDIRMAYDERENKMTELARRMEWWMSRDVLAIDELDKVGQTDWAGERIFQLLDARYQRAVRQEALTLIAANYASTDELSGYLRSRIEDNRFASAGFVIKLQGADGRKVMPKNHLY